MKIIFLERASNFISELIVKNIPLFITSSFLGLMGFVNIQSLLTEVGIPITLSLTAGNKIEKKNGGIIGVIATCGVLTNGGSPTFLGAIMTGVLCGLVVKNFNNFSKKYSKTGYEMIFNNLGMSILGILFATLLYNVFIPLQASKEYIFNSLYSGLSTELMMTFAIIVEPLKVFFLNNIINHGIFSIIGFSEVERYGKSLFFFLETNPGPGFGLLLAIYYYKRKKEVLSSSFIVLIGGVHELYFVHVLKKLYLLIPLVAGSLGGTIFNYIFNSGLEGIASPGSILMIELLAPNEDKLTIFASIVFSALITFFLSTIFLKREGLNQKELKREPIKNEVNSILEIPKNILVVCNAGMGSSAMGASFLKQKLMKKGIYDIKIDNSSIDRYLEVDADLIIMHREIYRRITDKPKGINIITIDDFLDGKIYDELIDNFLEKKQALEDVSKKFLKKSDIKIGLKRTTKDEALKKIGESLHEAGYVKKEYIESIDEREKLSSTYLENGVALPHGTEKGRNYIKSPGIVIHQYPYGIDYGNDKLVYVLIGVAAKGDEHMEILNKLALIIDEDDQIDKLCLAVTQEEIYDVLNWEDSSLDK